MRRTRAPPKIVNWNSLHECCDKINSGLGGVSGASQRSHLVHSAPRPARCDLHGHCCKSRLHAHVVTLLTFTHVLQGVDVVISDVPDDPIWHPTLCEGDAWLARFREHYGVTGASVQELHLSLAIANRYGGAVLDLGPAEAIADGTVVLLSLQPLDRAFFARLAAEVRVQATGELQCLLALVDYLHLEAQRPGAKRDRVQDLPLPRPLLQHIIIWNQAQGDGVRIRTLLVHLPQRALAHEAMLQSR
mmetsp:Transcript_24708/g.51352  ORF Transcript_24708/g.51352 Transcript_24708/m.51352 type:complete len:246 (-) Transcript_24708:173-910(-)